MIDWSIDVLAVELEKMKHELATGGATTHASVSERLAALRTELAALEATLAPPAGRPHHGLGALTARQREVLCLIAEGRSMKQAAAALQVSPRTVAFHKYRMMRQLRLRTSAELLLFAMRTGLVAG